MSQQRLRLEISGAVQGVGFRPFVYRLARAAELSGWVLNDSRGVIVEVEGEREALEAFAGSVRRSHPPHAVVDGLTAAWLEPARLVGFEIRTSDNAGPKTVSVLPDIATCDRCLSEVFDSRDRRYGYPFTNCTDCGPRFSIIESLPYDRPNTTMRDFVMCERCRAEYEDPGNRRFHAQPNACPACGPQLELLDSSGRLVARETEARRRAADSVLAGRILAVKGLGGFHLMVAAADTEGVARLRRRKGRYEKPLALMVSDLVQARAVAEVSDEAASHLCSPLAPIVLLPKRNRADVAREVAPGNPNLGVMLAYTPLHHLLLADIGAPVIATSGNLSDEPIAIANDEAIDRLGKIADLFLVHDRPIARHVDDSVLHWRASGSQPIRRARGWAPLPVLARGAIAPETPSILGLGAHLKNTVALSVGERVFVSQHIGDMETPQAIGAFESVVADFLELYDSTPAAVARDLHPDYYSSRWLEEASPGSAGGSCSSLPGSLAGLPVFPVQHHHAHLASCLAEHGRTSPALGVTWDGTGYGSDETIWGGEFLLGNAESFERVASLRPFRLPGGDAAVREPRRLALALLWEAYGDAAFDHEELAVVRSFARAERAPLRRMLATGVAAPITTSAGRLFDAVAALLDLHHTVAFEGQAAMSLEYLIDPTVREAYSLPLRTPDSTGAGAARQLDWGPLVEAVLEDLRQGRPKGMIAAGFHLALVEAIVDVALENEVECVALTGGCFQNRRLSEWTEARLREEGFEVLTHRVVPPNDGGISLGQVAVAAARLQKGV